MTEQEIDDGLRVGQEVLLVKRNSSDQIVFAQTTPIFRLTKTLLIVYNDVEEKAFKRAKVPSGRGILHERDEWPHGSGKWYAVTDKELWPEMERLAEQADREERFGRLAYCLQAEAMHRGCTWPELGALTALVESIRERQRDARKVKNQEEKQ